MNMSHLIEKTEGKYCFQFGLSRFYPSNRRFEPADVFGDTKYISSESEIETITSRILKGENVIAAIDFNCIEDQLVSV